MYVCIRVLTIIYYRFLGCFVLLFVMYLITCDSLSLFSFDQAFAFVWMFERLNVWMLECLNAWMFECLKMCRRVKCLFVFLLKFALLLCSFLICLYVNMYAWLHVSLFAITFYIPIFFVSLLTRLHVISYVWVFVCL